jgi:tetratricopeptide (TPR) repeat protein
MFCRSCWANLPDGTEQCPKCHNDPRVPVAPPSAEPVAAASPLPPPTSGGELARAKAPGSRLAWVNMALAVAIVGGVGGPLLFRWWEDRQEALRSAETGAQAVAGPAALPELTPLAKMQPSPGPAGDDPDARAAKEAYTLFQRGDIPAACEAYRQLVARSGREDARRSLGTCYARLGRDAYQAGRYADAIDSYRQAVDASSDRAHWAALAIAYTGAGDLARAQSVLTQALRAYSDDSELLYLLADVQERQGRTREAVETLRRLLAREPGHARGRTLLTRLEREQGVEGGYWSQESPHFVVRYEGGGGIDVGRSASELLERAYESLGRDLGVYPKDRVQVGIYETKTFAEIGGIPPEFAEHVLGFYDFQKLRLRMSASQAGSIGLERLVRHEYTHLLIHLATHGNAPRWFHEGLAQVMEQRAAPRLVESDVVLDRQYFTLDGLERLFRSNAVGAAYQLSHIVVEYLVDRGGMSGIRALLGRLGQGDSMAQALKEGMGISAEDVEARLLAAGGRS